MSVRNVGGGANTDTSLLNGNANTTATGSGSGPQGHGTGAIAGGQLGCNYQDGNWVFGLEGEGYWSGIKGTTATSINFSGGEIERTCHHGEEHQ